MKKINTSPAIVTKNDLQGSLRDFYFKLKDEFNDQFDEIKEEQKKYHNENMNRLDEVMGELQTMRDENTIGTYQIANLRKDVDSIEKRVQKLEKTQSSS